MQGFGAVVVRGGDETYHECWEARTFALSLLLGIEGLVSGNGRRLGAQLRREEYLRGSYYERWLWSKERRLERRRTISVGEVDNWVDCLRAGESPPRRDDPAQAARACAEIRRADAAASAATPRFRVGDR